jgi:GNAT superfamily N-acetyltransferase
MILDIRIAENEDLPLLIQLYEEIDGYSALSRDKGKEIFAAISSIHNYHIYIVSYNQEFVGTFSLLFLPTMMHRGYYKHAVLDAVVVRKAFRGRGIGTEMMKTALKLSAEEGCYKVTLSSSLKRDRAHEFYQKLGFEQHGWSFKCVIAEANK